MDNTDEVAVACEEARSLDDLRSRLQAIAEDDTVTFEDGYAYVNAVLEELVAHQEEGIDRPEHLFGRLPEVVEPYARELYGTGETDDDIIEAS